MGKHEIVLAGVGGQGLILGGILLGMAATESGYYVAQSQSYGIAARGGSSQADVVISNEEIIYPMVVSPDIILALTDDAFAKYHEGLKPRGILIFDTDNVSWRGQEKNVYGFPFTSITRSMGNPNSINICALGTILGLTEIIPVKIMEHTITNWFAEKYREANLAVFQEGLKLVKN